jgi:hypothetical protein
MNDKLKSLLTDGKPKDLKKIRSVIAKYKNKNTDASKDTIESKIMKTLNINKEENKDTDIQLSEYE